MRPRRSAATLLAAVTIAASFVTGVSAVPAAATDSGFPSVTISDISPTTAGGSISGPFTLKVDVNLNGVPSVYLAPSIGLGINQISGDPQTISAEQCPAVCTATFDLDPTGWDVPIPTGWGSVSVYFISDVGSSTADRSVYFDNPVANTYITAVNRDQTGNAAGYAPWVLDSGGDFIIGSDTQRSTGEVIEARVYPAGSRLPGPAPILTTTGSWSQPPDGQLPTGLVHFDTGGMPAGNYPMIIRARNDAGQYGWSSETTLTVRHDPVTRLASFPTYLTADEDLLIGMEVNRPLPDGVTYSNFKVSLDGGPAQTLQAESWQVPYDPVKPVTGVLRLHPTLTPGDHTVTIQVLDTHGNPIGPPSTGTVNRIDFADTATSTTPLVVGKPGSVQFTGTAPTGLTYQSCSYSLVDPTLTVAGGGLCESGQTSYTKSVSWTPQAAGAGHVDTWITTEQGATAPVQTSPVTIYAARTAVVAAPSSSAYGTRPTATVTVRDLQSVGGALLAAPDVEVTLQRQASGRADWSDLGTALTDTAGRASVPFDNTVNGRLRALVTSTVPGETVASAAQSISSASTAYWSWLPKSARSGAAIRAGVQTMPYQAGAVIRVQARHSGGRWRNVGSTLVTASGHPKVTFRLVRRTTWQVRVLRAGTSNNSAGYSSIRRISIR